MEHELRNAYSLSQSEAGSDNAEVRARAERAHRAGYHVACVETIAYCPRTDAVLPFSRLLIVGIFVGKAAAERELARWTEPPSGEIDAAYLWPKPEPKAAPERADESNLADIPF